MSRYPVMSAAAVLALAACAAPAADQPVPAQLAGQDCFNVRSINSFSRVDRDTVRIKVGVSDYYYVNTYGVCQDLDWTRTVAIRATPSNWMCVGAADGDIFTERDRCAIRTVSRSGAPGMTLTMRPYSAPEID